MESCIWKFLSGLTKSATNLIVLGPPHKIKSSCWLKIGSELTLYGSSRKSLNLLGREYFFTNSSSTTQGAFSPVPARKALCRIKYRSISLFGGRSVRIKLSAGTLLMI
jgi:hypothetical protein